MRKVLSIVAVVALLGGNNAMAGSVGLDTSKRYEFTDCSSGGSSSQTLTESVYLFRVTTEDVWICYGATCASGGEKFPAGWGQLLSIPRGGQVISCRSAANTGDAIFTRAL